MAATARAQSCWRRQNLYLGESSAQLSFENTIWFIDVNKGRDWARVAFVDFIERFKNGLTSVVCRDANRDGGAASHRCTLMSSRNATIQPLVRSSENG